MPRPCRHDCSIKFLSPQPRDLRFLSFRTLAEATRSISVEGDYLVIDCRPQEVGAYLATMKRDVKNASRRYNAMMQARHKHSGREMQSHELELQLTRRDWWARVKWFVRNLGENLWL